MRLLSCKQTSVTCTTLTWSGLSPSWPVWNDIFFSVVRTGRCVMCKRRVAACLLMGWGWARGLTQITGWCPSLLFGHHLGQRRWHSCGLKPLQNSHKANAWSSVGTQLPNMSFPILCSKPSYGVKMLVRRALFHCYAVSAPELCTWLCPHFSF